jgi:Ca2+-binding RTX toxin-like protein
VAIIKGTDNPETLYGTTGDDTIYGYGGNDIIVDDRGDDWLRGGAGNDTLTGGRGVNDYWGGTGDDTVAVTTRTGFSDDLVHGFTLGADKIDVSAWGISDIGQIYDLLYTDKFNDAAFNAFYDGKNHVMRIENVGVNQLTGSDFVFSTGGPTNQTGTAHDDVLFGSAGGDTLNGGAGDDILLGGAGNDVLIGGTGLDDFDGGSGIDTVVYNYTHERVRIDLATGVTTFSDGAQESLRSIERAIGSTGNDLLIGTAGSNVLSGDAGDDVIKAAGGNDFLRGGVGADELTGGAGNDTFVYDALAESTVAGPGRDTIRDFSPGDVIGLTQLEASTGESFTFIGTAAFSHTAGELQYSIHAGNTFVSLDANGDAVSDFSIELLGSHTLQQSDFLL